MLISHIKKNLDVNKIIYFSDGAKQHFKNKYQMINLIHHREDFNVSAEWHVYAKSKSASDGIGALFKREAVRYSLICRPSETILSASRLAEWGQNHFENITILFYSQKEHEKVERFLKRRFEKAPAVSGILKNHCFLINKNRELLLKRYSNASAGSTIVYEV